MSTERRADRRKHKRHRAQVSAFVDIRIGRIKVGKIVDISRGGLAFRYVDERERLKEQFELDMYFRDNDFRMEYVPVKTIWDRGSARELSFSTRTRLRGVQFGKLKQTQFSELERFLLLNTLIEEERPATIH
jgi:hypothetical protein